MRHEKLTEVSISFFFRAADYTVVMETSGIKYGTKKIRRRATEIIHYMVKFQDCSQLKLIVFFISQFYAWRDQIVST